MKTLFTLDYKNYNPNWKYSKRDSARGIIIVGNTDKHKENFSLEDKITLVYAKNLGYYKFPGGGIHADENKIDALIREVSEEIGLSVIPESVREFGVVPRFQLSSQFPETVFDQESFYYFCDVDTKGHQQNLDDYEAEAGFELQTVTIKEALEKNLKFTSANPFDLAMITRDTNVLQLLAGLSLEPSKAIAEFILEEGYKLNPGPWKLHSIAVAKAAEKIANAIVANGGKSLNPEKAYVFGLLHDIGRRFGYTYLSHVIDGYEYLHNFGYDTAAQICITHSFNLQDINDYIGKKDVTDEQYEKIRMLLNAKEFDDYDRLIQLLDSTCGADGTQNLEERMNDVKSRYGYYPQSKWDKNFELKSYFEKLMGKNFYEVIR